MLWTFIFLLVAEGSSVSKANYDRVHLGMTHEEVYAILGGSNDHLMLAEGRGGTWDGMDGSAYIVFGKDGSGTVSKMSWYDSTATLQEKIEWEWERRWSLVKWRARRYFDS